VTEYGFKAALNNNVQVSGPEGDDYIFYHSTEFETFSQTFDELDVLLYLHPSPPTRAHSKRWYEDRKWLMRPAPSFANDVARHLLGMIVNGTFDRHAQLQVVVGHLGEHIVADIWRYVEDAARITLPYRY
jgi:2,3-dihydroxybenzoate decarboxylase